MYNMLRITWTSYPGFQPSMVNVSHHTHKIFTPTVETRCLSISLPKSEEDEEMRLRNLLQSTTSYFIPGKSWITLDQVGIRLDKRGTGMEKSDQHGKALPLS